ncbi:ExbD/TolR family protein [Flavobacterium johnsoniae]|uniref:ExbD/TolR family protein n=1 Tax=Flavobacterium johnsoniae TaxID=986 RepID=UPI0011EF70AF|nr:biopolymer transporter ExbD [Flavobacterium johnsoniae]
MKNLPKKVRSKKLSSRVDLTAMVSVSFLLIIFFMVVGELSKAKIMDLSLPHNNEGRISCGPIREGENRSITVILDDNNRLTYYMGLVSSPIIAPKEIQYGKEGIRKELLIRKQNILNYSSKNVRPENLIVIIKPSKKSNFKNLVDILDEMAITEISTYAIIPEFTPEESKLLASK